MNVGVIILQALTEICRILQIRRGMVAVHFLAESQYPALQVNLFTVLDDKQLQD